MLEQHGARDIDENDVILVVLMTCFEVPKNCYQRPQHAELLSKTTNCMHTRF